MGMLPGAWSSHRENTRSCNSLQRAWLGAELRCRAAWEGMEAAAPSRGSAFQAFRSSPGPEQPRWLLSASRAALAGPVLKEVLPPPAPGTYEASSKARIFSHPSGGSRLNM